jgi:hypothetical protein
MTGNVLELPSSTAAEEGLLCCIYLSNGKLFDDVKFKICEDDFNVPAHRDLFFLFEKMHAIGKSFDPVLITQELKDTGQLVSMGGPDFLNRVFEKTFSVTVWSEYAEVIRKKAIERQRRIYGEKLARGTAEPEDDERFIELLNNGAKQSITIKEILRERAFDLGNPPPEIRPSFSIGESGICHAGNLTGILAQAKHGKSAFIGAMIAATLTPEKRDCLGVEGYNEYGKAVLHFDTEQSSRDHHDLLVRSLRRAGLSTPPKWLRSWSLKGLTLKERTDAMRFALENANAFHKGIHALILDGGADFVLDVNDAEEANRFIDDLEALATKYACPIIVILHLNPTNAANKDTGKSRGHLGSQLDRKAETLLILEKDASEITTVYTKHARHRPIPKGRGPSFSWNEEAGMHTLCQNESDAKADLKQEQAKEFAASLFRDWQNPLGMTWKELHGSIMSMASSSTRTAERRIAELQKLGAIHKSQSGLYQLSRA